jgi:A/G-specific adenine glycosylase
MHAASAGETLSFICVNPSSPVAFPKAQFRRALINWYRRSGRDLPWRGTRDPYAILVSELMLQQTQVATVIPYYNEWLCQFPDFSSLARASENDALHAWQGLGYYARARNLHAIARAVVDRHRGRFPRLVEKMQRLPGIGKYTAHAVASFAFDQSVPIVESNTARVLTRLFDFRESIDSHAGRATLWQHSAKLLPKRNAGIYNSALIDLGALVCVPREPKCAICPVKRFCRAENPQTLPVRKSRSRTKRLIEEHAFVIRQGKILLEQSATRWRGMWILPPLQTSPANQQPIYKSIFPFTNHRIALLVYRRSAPKAAIAKQRWFESIDRVPMPSPHRRATQALVSKLFSRDCRSSQRKRTSPITPAAVVKAVMGSPNRA